MPIPFLPPELITEIISHLQDEDLVEDQIRDGKAVSLVCRGWRRLGQALRWRTIQIYPERAVSLTEHFSRFPQLSATVKFFKVLKNNQGSQSKALDDSIIALIPMMPNLQALQVLGGMLFFSRELLRTLANLTTLEECVVCVFQGISWWSEEDLILRSGFKKLRKFCLSTFVFLPQDPPSKNLIGPPLALTKLVLTTWRESWTSHGGEGRFFPNFDPTTLRSASLGFSACGIDSLTWLSSCTVLKSLEIILREPLVQLKFPEILLFLPRFPALVDFQCKMIVTRDNESERLGSPVALTTVIRSFPPSLRLFEAREFIFPDYDTLSERAPPTTRMGGFPSVSALRPDEQEEGKVVPLSIWGEEKAGGGIE
ncbi:hypothetical protein JCM3765_006490 [Sporobolomyces pararoseus]